MSVCLDMRLGECEWGSEQAVGDWICLSVCTRVCVRAWPRVSVFVRAGDAKPKQHGSAERWPSWVEPACRVMSPPDVCVPSALTPLPDPISGPLSFSLSLTLSPSLIFLSSICPPPSYLPSLPYLSLALVVSSLLVWKVLSHPESILKFCLWTLLIFYAPHPKKKTKNRWHFFPDFLFSSSSLSSPPPSLFSPCFFPSSRCSTDPNWQSTCLFSLITHSLI